MVRGAHSNRRAPYYNGAQMPDILMDNATLVSFGRELLRAAEVPEDAADLVAVSLGASNLRGVDSHGFQLLPFYLEGIREGKVDVRTHGHVDHETAGCLTYDGENGIGQWISRQCC